MKMRCTTSSGEERVSEPGTKTAKSLPEVCSSSPLKSNTDSTISPKNWPSWSSLRLRRARSELPSLLLMRRYPVDLFFDCTLVSEPAPLQNRLAVLDHVGMTAEVSHRVAGFQFPMIGILAQNVIGASYFPRPI